MLHWRESAMSPVLISDTYRQQFPAVIGYTYYSLRTRARESGKGWRVDYFLVRAWGLAHLPAHSLIDGLRQTRS
jgi:exonuclease III